MTGNGYILQMHSMRCDGMEIRLLPLPGTAKFILHHPVVGAVVAAEYKSMSPAAILQ